MCEVQIYWVIMVLFFIKKCQKKKESLPTLPILFQHVTGTLNTYNFFFFFLAWAVCQRQAAKTEEWDRWEKDPYPKPISSEARKLKANDVRVNITLPYIFPRTGQPTNTQAQDNLLVSKQDDYNTNYDAEHPNTDSYHYTQGLIFGVATVAPFTILCERQKNIHI